jgi:integrase
MPTPPDIRSPVTLAEAWSLWLAYRAHSTRPLRASTLADYESIFRAHIKPALGAVPLTDLDGLAIARFVIERTTSGVSAKRLSNVLVPLRACLRWHFRLGSLARDPSVWFDVSAPAANERRILTIAQVERLIAEHPRRYRCFVAFAAYVGTRAGEQRALTWGDLDLERSTALINKTLFRNRAQRSTKTGHDRLVPLPPHIAELPMRERDLLHPPPMPDAFVFPGTGDRPIDLDNFRTRVFRPAIARAGLPSDLRFHDLRHTSASLLLQSGATVRDVMDICGWRQLATAQRYLHANPSLARAAQRLSHARAATLNPSAQAPPVSPRYTV